MSRSMSYSPKYREGAVRLVFDRQREHGSQGAAIRSIAEKLGCTPENLRQWVRCAERDQGVRAGMSGSERERHKKLERENRELERVNEILRNELAKLQREITETTDDKNITPADDARERRKRFNFRMVDIKAGTVLHFRDDSTITCKVVDDTQVLFRGEVTFLSSSAAIVLREMGYDCESASGPKYWCFKGKTLYNLRLDT